MHHGRGDYRPRTTKYGLLLIFACVSRLQGRIVVKGRRTGAVRTPEVSKARRT
jgi:hypothetical protein